MASKNESHPLRCDHCGRKVKETMHTRSGYRVDYYSMHSGDAEPAMMLSSDGVTEEVFLKLLNTRELITCHQCYGDSAVQSERERWFRPERAGLANEPLRAERG